MKRLFVCLFAAALVLPMIGCKKEEAAPAPAPAPTTDTTPADGAAVDPAADPAAE
ncbi:MAG TPA: hypothetical protein PJ982_12310 [Lacipirellulaceae bacterium]|nr:hypothetical protein [Lacipirellulaceae bacterium]